MTPANQTKNASRRRTILFRILMAAYFMLFAAALTVLLLPQARAQQLPKAIPAPELEAGLDWINTDKPLTLKELQGRIVLLDFWTLCCINCIHTLPDLAKLEEKYPGVLVVIGVHSPKFPNEKKTESVRKAVLRYQVHHPVVNDANMAIWRRYGADWWPTLVLIDPDGNVRQIFKGEDPSHHKNLDFLIGNLIKQYKATGKLKTNLLDFQLAQRKEPPGGTTLYFPGKVLADQDSNRLFIADSTHHRIVITDLGGKMIAVAGTGEEGSKDGPFDKATFSDPQGMELVDDILYVADRKNHMIRALNLKKQTVQRVAGVGKQNFNRKFGGPGLKTGLNSPWDLQRFGNRLFIAMAGSHQIWTFDLKTKQVAPYAGTGWELIIDGPLARAAFSQPSGLATDGKLLYVADSETSAVRSVPLFNRGNVETIVGTGLFDFGDQDGQGKEVRLQHAIGIAHRDGKLYIADTYNSKIKLIDPARRTCKTIELKPAQEEDGPLLNEPACISFAGDKMYIADTNQHRIRVVDMNTMQISTLELQGVPRPTVVDNAHEKKVDSSK